MLSAYYAGCLEIVLVILAKIITFYMQVSIVELEVSSLKQFIAWFRIGLKLSMLLASDK